MAIKWRKNKNLKPEIIFKNLEKSKKVTRNQVSFSGFELTENEVVLATMLDFGDHVSSHQKSSFTRQAIWRAAKISLDPDTFIDEINKGLKEFLAKPEVQYQLYTTISITPPMVFPKIEVSGCKIIFSNKQPKKLSKNRRELFKTRRIEDPILGSSCYVVVKVKAKTPELGAEKALDALNLLRAFLCLQLNSSRSITFGAELTSINKVVLGSHHTIHLRSGKIATETYWYEPHQKTSKPLKIKSDQQTRLAKNIRWLIKKVDAVRFGKDLRKALLRYVNAYDNIDHHSTIITTWAALESLLTNETERNNDVVTRRCSSLFKEEHFHKQILEHIREYRNKHVHHGEASDDPTYICYQLQQYFWEATYFYLRMHKHFDSKSEVLAFLDLPTDIRTLKRQELLIRRAIKFRDPKTTKSVK